MSKRLVSRMLRQMGSQETVRVVGKIPVRRLARLALVAEEFGFAYQDTHHAGEGQYTRNVMILGRDHSPEAQRRAMENSVRFPQAGNGGDLPGMLRGGTLRPLPDVAPRLELLEARINFDLTRPPTRNEALALAVLAVLALAVNVVAFRSDPDFLLMILCLYLGVLALGSALFLWARRRNAHYRQVLDQAGLVPVPDRDGRLRYLPGPPDDTPAVPRYVVPPPPPRAPTPPPYAPPRPVHPPMPPQAPGHPRQGARD
ncbi:hypothetical protein [Streptomyces sp. NPDC005438]|uniref:hypothetical protein n=1 Tax=Streptomyces sp. NPDC005438 TaxID=3156880 RepID=UPI0033BBC64D